MTTRGGSAVVARLLALFFLFTLFTRVAPLWAGKDLKPGPSEALVTITVSDSELKPLEGVALKLVQQNGKIEVNATTDKDGKYVLILPQGTSYNVSCVHNGDNFDFGVKEVPSVEGPLNYSLKLKIKRNPGTFTQTSTVMVGGSAEYYRGATVRAGVDTRVTITVTDHEGVAEPDALLTLVGIEDGKKYSARTDFNGQYVLALPRGKTYQVTCAKYGVVFDLGPQQIPPVDVFMLNLMIKVSRTALENAYNLGATSAGGLSINAATAAQIGDQPGVNLSAAQASEAAEASAAARVVRCVVTVIVTDKQGNPESEATLKIKKVGGAGDELTGKTDSAGKYVFMLDQGDTYTATVEKYGQAVDGGTFTVPTSETHKVTMALEIKAVYAETYTLKNVYFDLDKATLRAESFKALDELVQVMTTHPTMVIELAGHTDSQGADAYNLKLSRARAHAVRDYLIDRGIATYRVSAKGYGELQPVATNDTEEGRQENRRTEVRVISR